MNWFLLKNSLLVASFTTLLAVCLGFIAALWLAGLEEGWRNRLLAASVMALALPPFLVTNCWLSLLGHNGVWHSWLPLDIISLGGTVWILSLLTWPITLLAVWSAWQRLEPSQLECDPAVTGWALVRGLLLPPARTALAQAAVLTFVLALNNFAVPAILQVKVAPAEMWVRFNTSFDSAGALRLSWPLVLGPLLVMLWLVRQEMVWPRLEGRLSPKLFRRQLGRGWSGTCAACTSALCLIAVGLPLFQLASVKRTWTELPGALLAGERAIWNSFGFAAAAAATVTVLGLTAACGIAARGRGGRTRGEAVAQIVNLLYRRLATCIRICLPSRVRSGARASLGALPIGNRRYSRLTICATLSAAARVTGWLLWLPFLVPGVLLGIGLIALFNRPGFFAFYQSVGIVLLAFVVRYLALGWNSAAHAVQAVDRDLLDVARLEGATPWQRLRHVQWPQIAPQAAAAAYVVFLLCLWDIDSMILVVPPGGETVAMRVFNLLHYGHNAQVNALCLTLLGLAIAPLVIWKGLTSITRARPVAGNGVGTARPHKLRTSATTGDEPSPPRAWKTWRAISGAWPRNFDPGPLSQPLSPTLSRKDSSDKGCDKGCDKGFWATGVWSQGLSVTLLACVLPLLSGCSPPSRSSEVPLESRLFSSVRVIGTRGVGVGQLNKPRSVAVDAQDNLYVVDMTGRVQKFSSNGVFLLSWQMPQTDLGKPKGLCRDREGNIIVVEPHYQRVNHFTTAGKLVAQWGRRGTNDGQLIMPRAVAVNSSNEAFVSEYGQVERVQRFRLPAPGQGAPPEFLGSFGHPGNAPGEFNRPEGLCVDAQDRVYVADSCNHRIQIFARDGKFLRAYGKPGSGRGELSYPYDICVDSAGRQYVCEFGNGRVQVFDANDQPIEIIGRPGAAPGQFGNPWGVALDSAGNLYVADSQNHRVQKLLRRSPPKGASPVAQISNLLYRRFPTCSRPNFPTRVRFEALATFGRLPIENRRYSRLEICATGGTGAYGQLPRRAP
jgi:ABC-type Fe3+ transport system permease subunit/DNA-binding beta-propeller fold protein YncE